MGEELKFKLKLQTLMGRLLAACSRLPDYGNDANGGMFSRGQAVLERKFGVRMWLSQFMPNGMSEESGGNEMVIKQDWTRTEKQVPHES